mgnify:FL=1
MPLQKGEIHTNGGRKGYEFERDQLRKMREMLSKYLILVEKVLDGKDNNKDYAKLATVGADMRKILDKLHATPQSLKVDGEIRLPLYLPSSLMQKHGLPQSTGTDSE